MNTKENTAARVLASTTEAARLRSDEGLDAKDIAVRLRRSATHVRGLLLLADAGAQVHAMVLSGRVSATLAIDHLREHGPQALASLRKHVEQAAARGVGKVKPAHLPGAAVKRAIRRIAPALVAAVRVLEKDPAYAQVAEPTRKQIGGLLRKVRQAEDSAPRHAGQDEKLP